MAAAVSEVVSRPLPALPAPVAEPQAPEIPAPAPASSVDAAAMPEMVAEKREARRPEPRKGRLARLAGRLMGRRGTEAAEASGTEPEAEAPVDAALPEASLDPVPPSPPEPRTWPAFVAKPGMPEHPPAPVAFAPPPPPGNADDWDETFGMSGLEWEEPAAPGADAPASPAPAVPLQELRAFLAQGGLVLSRPAGAGPSSLALDAIAYVTGARPPLPHRRDSVAEAA